MAERVTALDRTFANTSLVGLSLMKGQERIEIEMDHGTAMDIAHAIADALTQLRAPNVNPSEGVALYEATKFEGTLETKLTSLGVQEKFVLTARGQGSTQITLRLSPEKVDAFLSQMELYAPRKRTAPEH